MFSSLNLQFGLGLLSHHVDEPFSRLKRRAVVLNPIAQDSNDDGFQVSLDIYTGIATIVFYPAGLSTETGISRD
ncbi:hypothetical protein BDQ12DRAFT_682455, partial [Crucibulum laeve]